ncbi:MAG: hypothetical protein PHN92_10390 [Geobacter sp.]|nr:hypothetical protein [Geobacter sp.]
MKHPFMMKSHDNGTLMTRIWRISTDKGKGKKLSGKNKIKRMLGFAYNLLFLVFL